MNKTTNYQLNQWAKSDRVKMEDFNADNAKIDAALKAEADARAAAVSSLLSSRNCQAYITSYTGTGTAGENNPNSLSFARRPFFLYIGCETGTSLSIAYGQAASVVSVATSSRRVYFTWSGNSVSWHDDSSYKPDPEYQMNVKDKRYTVFALLSV